MVVKDIEREDVEFICKTIGATPVAHVDHLKPEKLGTAELCEESRLSDDSTVFKITGVPKDAKTLSVLVRGSNQLVIDEADRSLHDALCVVRSLVKCRGLIPGGGAPEVEIARQLMQVSQKTTGRDSMIIRAYAEALEVIPFTLAENAGLNPINTVTELKNLHAKGNQNAGLSVRKGNVAEDITTENVIQPSLVTKSALTLATECVRMILKIDDLVFSAR